MSQNYVLFLMLFWPVWLHTDTDFSCELNILLISNSFQTTHSLRLNLILKGRTFIFHIWNLICSCVHHAKRLSGSSFSADWSSSFSPSILLLILTRCLFPNEKQHDLIITIIDCRNGVWLAWLSKILPERFHPALIMTTK